MYPSTEYEAVSAVDLDVRGVVVAVHVEVVVAVGIHAIGAEVVNGAGAGVPYGEWHESVCGHTAVRDNTMTPLATVSRK
jgi:hypothetical protein